VDYPFAHLWVFYGDGRGGFRKETIATAYGTHEAKLADIRGEGRLDIIAKAYQWHSPGRDIWLNRGRR
jgi:hypothetical protein